MLFSIHDRIMLRYEKHVAFSVIVENLEKVVADLKSICCFQRVVEPALELLDFMRASHMRADGFGKPDFMIISDQIAAEIAVDERSSLEDERIVKNILFRTVARLIC